ncbi:MAG TPA: hypothetical protein VNL14_19810 [Candidatus Acidoferrales bacterium]|nr:hypothetical protein [Candidatus Acidoferrales bacterium]
MQGAPRDFESIGNRLGFHVREKTPDRLFLTWRGARFPGWLCLGLALLLLSVSIPIVQAIRLQGLSARVGALWYFPLMNLLLFGVGLFLLSLGRTMTFDRRARRVRLTKKSLFRTRILELDFAQIAAVTVGADQVYSGAAVAGSTVGQSFFPVQSLRLVLHGGESVLLERGSRRRVENLGKTLSAFLNRPLVKNA